MKLDIKDMRRLAGLTESVKPGPMTDKCFVFTGFRSSELEAKITKLGGKVASTFTKEVTHVVAKDLASGSGKIQKAKEAGVKVISIKALETMLAK